MSLDEKLAILTRDVQMLLLDSQTRNRDIEQLLEIARNHSESLKADSEHIRALVRIAEIHERRLTVLEGIDEDDDDTSGKPE